MHTGHKSSGTSATTGSNRRVDIHHEVPTVNLTPTTGGKTMKAMTAIKKYFEMSAQEAAREVKELTHEDRQELGILSCVELGENFEPSDPPKKK